MHLPKLLPLGLGYLRLTFCQGYSFPTHLQQLHLSPLFLRGVGGIWLTGKCTYLSFLPENLIHPGGRG
jgi:hypothetical protein